MSDQQANVSVSEAINNIPEEIRPPKPNLDIIRKLEFGDDIISRLENLPVDELAKKGNLKGVAYSDEKKNLAAEFFASGKFESLKQIAEAVGMKAESNVRSALKFYPSKKNEQNQKEDVLQEVRKWIAKRPQRKIDPNSIPEYVAVVKDLEKAKERIRELELEVVRAQAKADAFIEFHQQK